MDSFKCLRNLRISLRPPTIFVGPNCSGKSSVLRAMLAMKKLFLAKEGLGVDDLFKLEGLRGHGLLEGHRPRPRRSP